MPARRRLQRPDLRLVERQTGPDWVLDRIYLLQPMTPWGKAWLEAHAAGRPWSDGALVIDPGIYGPGSLLAVAREAGLGLTGCGPVSGAMLEHLRIYGAPELTLAQLARRLGLTVQEWKLVEADERLLADPDDFWTRAMALVDELQNESESRADAAGFN
jgi:hypothetical protein